MKRFFIPFVAVLLFIVGAGVFFGNLFAGPLETEALVPPVPSPSVITPDIPTFITFTASIADPDVRSPKLQFFDPSRSRWKTIGRFRNDGKLEDQIKGDQEFTLRVYFLDSGDTTQIRLPRGKKLKLKGAVPSPVQMRVAARKKGVKGILTSPTLNISAVDQLPVTIGDGSIGPPASVKVPATFDTIDTSDPTNVFFEKVGPDGYRARIHVRSNLSGLPLEQWILQVAFRWGEASIPSPPTLADDPSISEILPITTGGLSGIQLVKQEEHLRVVHVFLNDPNNQRVFWFLVFGTGIGQQLNLDENLTEAISIIFSLQP